MADVARADLPGRADALKPAGRFHSGQAWLTVALLWVVAALNYLDRILLTTMHASLVAAIPMSEAQFGLLSSAFLWVYAFASPFAGFLADRYRRGGVIVASLLVWSAMTWLTGEVRTYGTLLTVRALMGLSEASYLPAALALIADFHPARTRSSATGAHMTGIFAGSALGGLGGWLADHRTWHFAFKLFGGFGVAYALVLALVLKEAPGRAPRLVAGGVRCGATLRGVWNGFGFRPVLAYWGLLGAVGWLVVGWMPTYLNEHFGLSQGAAGLSSSGFLQIASLLGVMAGGFWADRWTGRDSRGPFWVTALGLGAAAPGILMAALCGGLPWALGGLAVYGLTRAFADSNMMPILCQVAPEAGRATGYGLLNFFSCLVGGIGILAAGVLRDGGVPLGTVFAGAGGLLLFCSLLIAATAARLPRHPSAQLKPD